MNARDIWILYRMEIRSAFRERSIVVNSILMPIFLYPVLLWVTFSAMTFIQGLNEQFTSRVALVGDLPSEHRAILDSLEARDKVQVIRGLGRDEAVSLIRAGELDVLLSFLPPDSGGASLPGNFRVQALYDRSEARGQNAVARVREVVDDYRTRWIGQEAEARGMTEQDRRLFWVADEDISTETDLGNRVLGLLIPLFLTIMVALGCFFPAVDTTAGERERSTWETLMTTSASRGSLVTAKYLYVATMGVSAGILNVVAIVVSIGAVMAPILGETEGINFRLPLLAIPVMFVGAMVLALLLSAGMVILASFARTFKDGQAMVQPVYFAAIVFPLLLGQQTDITLSPGIAAVPVANVAMMIRDAINGVFLWPYMVESLVLDLLLVYLCLRLARFILRFEDFLIGSYSGSFWRFARERMGFRSSKKDLA
jgi:sodium transport system permease protein